MSAYIVHPDHITYLVQAAISLARASRTTIYYGPYGTGTPVELHTGTEVGAKLLQENIESVRYRYPNCAYDELPGPIPLPSAIDYRYRSMPVRFDPVQFIKAAHCYQYQSCEHPGWHESDAKRFCDHVIDYAISHLPGYDEAAWEVTRERTRT